MNKTICRAAVVALIILGAGCKLQVIVPVGGTVITQSGTYTCFAGQTCEISVVDLFFDETFTAVPDSGFFFANWKKKAGGRGFCATASTGSSPCRLYTSFFAGWPNLFSFLATNEVFFLEPVFVLKGCNECPEMMVIPAGSFKMGSNTGSDEEKPVHTVSFADPFAIGVKEMTFAQWDRCVSAGGCTHSPDDEGWGRGRRPVMNVSWDEISNQYLPWLNSVTGNDYRFPSESE
jgi:hypothetical protein